MRLLLLFTGAVTACSGGAPAGRPRVPAAPPTIVVMATEPSPDAPPARTGRGDACSSEQACDDDLVCLPLVGGYCASACGVTGSACDGACVETPGSGELCLASCASDADCRTTEGYVCDRHWKACLLPNGTAIVPRSCPTPIGIGRDPAFAPSERMSTAATPGSYQLAPAAVVTDDGGLVTVYGTRGPAREDSALGMARIDAQGRVTIDQPFGDQPFGDQPMSDRPVGDRPASAALGGQVDPRLARSAKGTLYAAWRADDAIVFARSRDRGLTWSAPAVVHAAGDCSAEPADCVDRPLVVVGPAPGHRGEIVYVMYAANGLRVRASRDGGTTFGPSRVALAGTYGNATVGSDGRLHVVMIDAGRSLAGFGSGDHKVEYTVSADGGRTFSRPHRINLRDETLPFFFANPSVAVDDRRGWIYVAYTRGGRDAIWDVVIAGSRDRGKTWKRTRITDDPACAIHMVPNLAVDPTTGRLHIAWYDSRGDHPRFAHAECKPGLVGCTQVGRINDVPLAALSTVRFGAKWIGESAALVIDDRRRVLHAVWAQPVDENGTIVSRIFHAKAKLPRR